MTRALSSGLLAGLISATAASCGASEAPAEPQVSVAVAANFAQTHRELARRFEEATGARVVSSIGATGQLYAQIRNGAPFDVFLAADTLRPRLLEDQGLAVPGTRFTYATGRLALYGPGLDSVRWGGVDVTQGNFTNLAMANPRTAPYGEAAEAVLERVEADSSTRSRIVRAENVAQTLQFVRSGAAELGFVALAQVIREPERSYWLVPAEYHLTLAQDAVLLRTGEGNPIARDYMEFLSSEPATEIIASHGYETERSSGP